MDTQIDLKKAELKTLETQIKKSKEDQAKLKAEEQELKSKPRPTQEATRSAAETEHFEEQIRKLEGQL